MKKILFGAGKIGQYAIDYYGKENIIYFCDNNKDLHGKLIKGCAVISVDELKKKNLGSDVDVVITIENSTYASIVAKMLDEAGIKYTFFLDEIKYSDSKSSFSDIYLSKKWGECVDGEQFYSGKGSHDEEIIIPYISLIKSLIKNNQIQSIIDIGCGDFWIMRQVINSLHNISYIGIDVVDKLINHNNVKFGSDNIKFMCMDVADKEIYIPKGDLVIIRQVLQHLDNSSIQVILDKVKSYRFVLITEHIYSGEDVKYNLDKPINDKIRLYKRSGVYIDKPPYNLKNVIHLLNIESDGGCIRTSLLIND